MLVEQFRVEIEYYSVVYFNRVTAFKALYLWTSVKGRAHTRCIVVSIATAVTLSKYMTEYSI